MVPCLARDAVIIKSKNNTALLSNYELAYAVGILCKIGEIPLPQYVSMRDLLERVKEPVSKIRSEEVCVRNLIHMVSEYVPTKDFDDQMDELVMMGIGEKYMWNEKEF